MLLLYVSPLLLLLQVAAPSHVAASCMRNADLVVSCTPSALEISLKKHALLSFISLSLIDPECPWTDNSTHAVLVTSLERCGTQRVSTSSNEWRYENVIEIVLTDSSVGSNQLFRAAGLVACSGQGPEWFIGCDAVISRSRVPRRASIHYKRNCGDDQAFNLDHIHEDQQDHPEISANNGRPRSFSEGWPEVSHPMPCPTALGTGEENEGEIAEVNVASNVGLRTKTRVVECLSVPAVGPVTDDALLSTRRVASIGFKMESRTKTCSEVSGSGRVALDVRVFSDRGFSRIVQQPIVIKDRYPHIYVSVSPWLSDPTVGLVPSICYITPTSEKGDKRRHLLLEKGCIVDGTFQEFSSDSEYRFGLQTFRFALLEQPQFFIHCLFDLCNRTMQSCARTCEKSPNSQPSLRGLHRQSTAHPPLPLVRRFVERVYGASCVANNMTAYLKSPKLPHVLYHLDDSDCQMHHNGTHYVHMFRLHSCGMTSTRTGTRMTHHNHIHHVSTEGSGTMTISKLNISCVTMQDTVRPQYTLRVKPPKVFHYDTKIGTSSIRLRAELMPELSAAEFDRKAFLPIVSLEQGRLAVQVLPYKSSVASHIHECNVSRSLSTNGKGAVLLLQGCPTPQAEIHGLVSVSPGRLDFNIDQLRKHYPTVIQITCKVWMCDSSRLPSGCIHGPCSL